MICFETQTAIVNPLKKRPAWHWGIHSSGNACRLAALSVTVRSGSRLCFHQTFYLLLPYANCASWGCTDRFWTQKYKHGDKRNKQAAVVFEETNTTCELWTSPVYIGLRLDSVSPRWWVRTSRCLCIHYRRSMRFTSRVTHIYAGPACNLDYNFRAFAPAGAIWCCIFACTTNRDFHSQRPRWWPVHVSAITVNYKSSPPKAEYSALILSCLVHGRRKLLPIWDTQQKNREAIVTDLWNSHSIHYRSGTGPQMEPDLFCFFFINVSGMNVTFTNNAVQIEEGFSFLIWIC